MSGQHFIKHYLVKNFQIIFDKLLKEEKNYNLYHVIIIADISYFGGY